MTGLSRDTKKRLSRFLHACTQRISGITLLFIVFLLFAGPPLIPGFYWSIVLVFHVFLVTNAVRLAAGLVLTTAKTQAYVNTDWVKRYQEFLDRNGTAVANALKADDVKHLIIIPNYKEEFEVLCETLDTIANHERAKIAYKVIMAMEAGEKGSDEKAEKLIKLFGHRFFSMQYTVHPSGIPGEARGKSSNVAWAARYYAENWLIKEESRQELITVMDADTQLTEKYFQCLAYKYCTTPSAEHGRCLFAPVLIFDRNANHVPFVVRLADFCWSIGLMANFQLPVKFPCSVYTVSMLLAQEVGFWDAGPESIGEDIHMALKCWTHLRMNLKMTPIYIPASCSNVQGDSYWSSIAARFEQSKRHLWGSLDFGYLAARLITKRCWTASPFRSIFSLYILFEIFFQPYFGFYHLTGQFIYPSSLTTYGALILEYTTYIRLALIPFALIVAFAYERYHAICCQYRQNVLQQIVVRKQAVEVMADEGALAGVPMSNDEDGLVIEQVASGNEIAFRRWYQILDWAGLPFCLIAYYMIPGVNAMIGQLFTKKLDYKVSLKPTAAKPAPALAADAPSENPASGDAEVNTDSSDMVAVVIDEGKTVTAASSSDSLAGKARKTGFMKKFIQDGIVRGHAPSDSGVELESIRQPRQEEEQQLPTSTAH